MKVYNIRGGRKGGGLREQHLRAIQATGELVRASLKGAELGSNEIVFCPRGMVDRGEFRIELGTAGSVGLVFQTVFVPLSFHRDCSLVIKGGTHVRWSPVADYIGEVFLPAVERMGPKAAMEVSRWGFYPRGGGIVRFAIRKAGLPLKPINVMERGRPEKIYLIVKAGGLPEDVVMRGVRRATERLDKEGFTNIEVDSGQVGSAGRGMYMFLLVEYENIRAGFTAPGERGRRVEALADELVDGFTGYARMEGAVDIHLSDQLLLYMALAEGMSRLSTPAITEHARTNASIIERFLPVRFEFSERARSRVVKVEGVGYRV